MSSNKIIYKSGYHQFKKIPTKAKLDEYYKKKYFNTNKSYNYNFSLVEKKYHENNTILKLNFLKKILKKKNCRILEIGSGQGHFVNTLSKLEKRFKITAVDYSKKNFLFHENKKIDFIEANPEIYLNKKNNFDVVFFNNVLEHVSNPLGLINIIKKNFIKKCIFCIVLPNDFSNLQNFLIKKKNVNKKYWISFPEHLNYFSKNDFIKFAKKNGFKTIMSYAEFPIEIFLLNKKTNYVVNKKNGKNAHDIRCKFLNYLVENNKIEDVMDLYLSFSKNEIGRDNIFFIKTI